LGNGLDNGPQTSAIVEWKFAFETQRIVSRGKIDDVVDDIVKLLEYAKGFPQEHLMSAGQILLNRTLLRDRFVAARGGGRPPLSPLATPLH
jgi:hypothetical protein